MYVLHVILAYGIILSVAISDKLTALLCNLLQFQKHKKVYFSWQKKLHCCRSKKDCDAKCNDPCELRLVKFTEFHTSMLGR